MKFSAVLTKKQAEEMLAYLGDLFTEVRLLDIEAVKHLEKNSLSLRAFWEKCQKKNVTLIFSHVNEQPMSAMKKSGLYDKVGAENFCAHIDDALERGAELGEFRQ